MADEWLNLGDVKRAAPALAAGVALLGDARNGILGNYAQYLDARVQFAQNRGSAHAALATALAGQQKISHPLFQLAMANRMFDAQTLPMRSAAPVYEQLLGDPSPADQPGTLQECAGRLPEPLRGSALPVDDRLRFRCFQTAHGCCRRAL